MSAGKPQPNTPEGWKAYAESDVVTSIPLRQGKGTNEKNTYVERGIYLDESTLANHPEPLVYFYTDIFALTTSNPTITLPPLGELQITTRVLTASTPINITVAPTTNSSSLLRIYAQLLDQPITVSKPNAPESARHPLTLGNGSKNLGAEIVIPPTQDGSGGDIEIQYVKGYPPVADPERQATLETQLRIALAQFWRWPAVAISLCTYVASVTGTSTLYPETNAQAVALGQQLAAQALTGPNMSYAPVLSVGVYRGTVEAALDAVEGFEAQYDRFQARAGELGDQVRVWDAMIEHARIQHAARVNASSIALEKYRDACEVVFRCEGHLRDDNQGVETAAAEFIQALQEWEAIHVASALFKACMGLLKFASGLGLIELFDSSDSVGGGFKDLSDAYNDFISIDHIENETDVKVKPETLQELTECMETLESLYPPTDAMVSLIEQVESNADANTDIPSLGGVAGGDADARAIVAVAAWDKWSQESVDQVEVAVGAHISGAREYRLALEKQAVDGKALAQADAEAVRAGHEYIAAAVEVIASMKDIQVLKELRAQYKGEEEVFEKAAAKFYSRFLAIRTSLVIEMRKLVWAYKYNALSDSRVELDSQQRSYEFRNQLLVIATDIESADEHYSTDYQPFEYITPSSSLPSNYSDAILNGLKGETHSASFTLAPRQRTLNPRNPNTATNDFASVFTNGSHYRLHGLEVALKGATPKAEAVRDDRWAQLEIQIITSGVYADVKDGNVLYFTSLPQSKLFTYEVSGSGEKGRTVIRATYETLDYAEPTPFTQWTIRILNPEAFDFSGLAGVDLEWTGTARFGGGRGVGASRRR